MERTEYRGRKLTVKIAKNKSTGASRFEVRCNGKFCYYGSEMSAVEALEMAKRYVDQAELRPSAYPNFGR